MDECFFFIRVYVNMFYYFGIVEWELKKNFSSNLVNFNISCRLSYGSLFVYSYIYVVVIDDWEVSGDYDNSRRVLVLDCFVGFFVVLVLWKRRCVFLFWMLCGINWRDI